MPEKEPPWVPLKTVLAIHEALIARFGGLSGVRDLGLVESALARPRNLYTYDPETTLVQLATAYAFGLAKNRAFVDGNKRTGWMAAYTFLEQNGRRVTAAQAEVVIWMRQLAEGLVTEEEFSWWLRENCGK